MSSDILYCKMPQTENGEVFDVHSVPKSYYRPTRFEDLPFHLSQSYPPAGQVDILFFDPTIQKKVET